LDRIEIGLWQLDLRAKKCVDALRRNGFDADFLPDQEAVRARVLAECDPAASVGFGGSMSVAGLGIFEALSGAGKKLYDHGRVPPEERAATRLAQLTCDLFLTGTNAVTLEGCLVNLDMNGNRTNAMAFGPKKIVVVAGGQKIVADLPEAIRRIKAVSAPRNARRLKLSTPCTVTGFCEDCNSPQRICRVYSIIERRPANSDIAVLVCGEPLGL
jgi:hypothetical protein